MPLEPVTWSAPVRYAEADQQGVVFNAHYLVWCDEALNAFCAARSLADFGARVRLKRSTLTWTAAAHWGQTVTVEVRCTSVGRTSATLAFDVRADGAPSCTVETVYVLTGVDGRPAPIDDATRARLVD